VSSHVYRQSITTSEPFPAYFTAIRLLSSVRSHVPFLCTWVFKSFPTGITGVRFLPRVNSCVGGQMGALPKTFPTTLAGIWPLTSVRSDVTTQFLLFCELLATGAAGERFLSCVRSSQTTTLSKTSTICLVSKWRLVSVDYVMFLSLRLTLKGFSTNIPFCGLSSWVNTTMTVWDLHWKII